MSVNTARTVPHNETPYKKVLRQLLLEIEEVSLRGVYIFSFNVPPDQLQKAHAELDEADGRKLMKVSYSDEYNFIVRYTPSRTHVMIISSWSFVFMSALERLSPMSHSLCSNIGATTFEFGEKQKQPDNGVWNFASSSLSIVLEVGDLGSSEQLQTDARLWLRDMPEIHLVILLLIDPPAPNSTLPRISLQLWKAAPSTATQKQRDAHMAWATDWTNSATELYILLSDIFGQQVPNAFGTNDRVYLDTEGWRQQIIRLASLYL